MISKGWRQASPIAASLTRSRTNAALVVAAVFWLDVFTVAQSYNVGQDITPFIGYVAGDDPFIGYVEPPSGFSWWNAGWLSLCGSLLLGVAGILWSRDSEICWCEVNAKAFCIDYDCFDFRIFMDPLLMPANAVVVSTEVIMSNVPSLIPGLTTAVPVLVLGFTTRPYPRPFVPELPPMTIEIIDPLEPLVHPSVEFIVSAITHWPALLPYSLVCFGCCFLAKEIFNHFNK